MNIFLDKNVCVPKKILPILKRFALQDRNNIEVPWQNVYSTFTNFSSENITSDISLILR